MTSRGVVAVLVSALLAAGAGVGPAAAQGFECRDTIAREAGKYLKAKTKALTKCNDGLVKAKGGFNGDLGRGCRDTAGKTQEKLDKARDKFLSAIDRACGGDDRTCNTADDLDIDDPELGWGSAGGFGNGIAGICPDFESVGCTNIIRHCGGADSDGEGITDCVLCINDEAIERTVDLLYADLDDAKFGAGSDPDKTINRCQQALVRAGAKHVFSKSKNLGKCWGALNKGKAGFSSSDVEGCLDASGKTAARIDKSESKKIAAICKKCGGPDKACDQVIPTIAGTLVKGAMGEGTGGDLDPVGDIGFGAACPDVVLPHVPNTDCGTLDDLPSGANPDDIETMEEFVKCLDCVLEFKMDCADRSVHPFHEGMPASCNACVTDTSGAACPSTLQLTADPFESSLDLGFIGLGHDIAFPSNARLTVGLSGCDGTTRPTCGECDISGPLPNTGGTSFLNQRCRSDGSMLCFADSDCPASDTCVVYFGVPRPESAGSVPFCTTSEIVGAVTGTIDIEGGTSALTLPLRSRIHIGVQAAKPCPTCEFDDTDQRFECTHGPREDLACNVDGHSPLFGALSYDCQSLGGLGELDITLHAATGMQTATLSAASPSCTAGAFTTAKCLCSTCDDVASTPCFTDADCAAVGATTCGGDRCVGGPNDGDPCVASSDCAVGFCGVPGQPTVPNDCTDAICTPVPADTDSIDEGECANGPFDLQCSIESFRPCAADADCRPPAENGNCAACLPGMQTCTVQAQQCYTVDGNVGEAVQVAGAADAGCGDAAAPKLGALFCMSQTPGVGFANAVYGLPGLGRLDLEVAARYE